MTTIKVLLLAGIGLSAVLVYRGGRTSTHRALWRLGGLATAVVAAGGVLFPDSVTRLANAVGVGRGTDLVLYVLVVAFMLVTVGLFRRLSELENRYVALARKVAIAEALADRAPFVAEVVGSGGNPAVHPGAETAEGPVE